VIYLVYNIDYSSSSRSNSLDWSDGWGKKRDNAYRVKCREGGGGVSIMMLELYVGEIRGFWKCIG